jgi:hypothetical protein
MKVVFVPLFRTAISYTVSFGRRWSILEQMLLLELAQSRRSVAELVALCDMPDRLVIEALINLLRATWIEVRSTESGVIFAATAAGKHRVAEEELPSELKRAVKWASLCSDRLTGSWLRADDLDLVYERDLPSDALRIEPRLTTIDVNSGGLRSLLHLSADENLEPETPNYKTPSRPYARVEIAFDRVQSGLPSYASVGLIEAVLTASATFLEQTTEAFKPQAMSFSTDKADDIDEDDLIVGGAAHLELVKHCLENAKTNLIMHSCFVGPRAIRLLLPDFEKAAKRKVRIELLWGLNWDPDKPTKRFPIAEADKVLGELPAGLRSRIQLSPISSRSHAKAILYDQKSDGKWVTVIGSCNFLSSEFDWMEVSVRCRSQRLAEQVLSWLIGAQLPAVGSWSPTAKRLNRLWSEIRHESRKVHETGSHKITLLVDSDHYTCVTRARDLSSKSITVACDLFGLSAETSVLVPMETAAKKGCAVNLIYSRPSETLIEEGRPPDADGLRKRGISISQIPEFHAKFLVWDEDCLAVTSFNWMSTVVEGARSGGAELGLLIEGPKLREMVSKKLSTLIGGYPG